MSRQNSLMYQYGEDIADDGIILSKEALSKRRRKKGQCETCGLQCFDRSSFLKMVPRTVEGDVLNGRCLHCQPLDYSISLEKSFSKSLKSGSSRASTCAKRRLGYFQKEGSDSSIPSLTSSERSISTVSSIGSERGIIVEHSKPEHSIQTDQDSMTFDISEETAQLMDAGGLDAIIQIMKMNKRDQRVQLEGMRRMVSLLEKNNADISEDIGYLGGLDLIFDAMDTFPDNLWIQKHSWHALWMLSANYDNCSWMLRGGIVVIVLSAIERHIQSSEMIECLLGLLSRLESQDEYVNLLVIENGGMNAINSALIKHIDNPHVFKWVSKMRENLDMLVRNK